MARIPQIPLILFHFVLCLESLGQVYANDSSGLKNTDSKPEVPRSNFGHLKLPFQGKGLGLGNVKTALQTNKNSWSSWKDKAEKALKQKCFYKYGRWWGDKRECDKIWNERKEAGYKNESNSVFSDVINHEKMANTYQNSNLKASSLPKGRLKRRQEAYKRWKNTHQKLQAYKRKKSSKPKSIKRLTAKDPFLARMKKKFSPRNR